MLRLRTPTVPDWVGAVRDHVDAFLQDHAANERKVSASALQLAVQHPERHPLVDAMVALAREELEHFARVHALLRQRDKGLAQDAPDAYMGALHRLIRKADVHTFLLDRLLVFGIVEARACERFGLLAAGLPDPALRAFYAELTRAEARHHALFVRLAHDVAPGAAVSARLAQLLDAEAEIVAALPVRPALH
ncbi:tRNA-(ms[2]io[6]A)-hydroxylase [bacterium]|nr:tRNA-(ms[2]io[6]A)-hydroxylase [bacterium]